MRHNKLVVFAGSISALVIMTVVSTLLGYGITSLIPPIYTFYASVALMFFFGFKMFWDAYRMKPTEKNDIRREVEEQLGKKDDIENNTSSEVHVPIVRLYCSFWMPKYFILDWKLRGKFLDRGWIIKGSQRRKCYKEVSHKSFQLCPVKEKCPEAK